MGLYSRYVFPCLCEWALSGPQWDAVRRKQLADVRGDVLEIGVGTGLNLPHYPDHVKRITTVDPNRGMNRRLERRIRQTGMQVDRRVLSAERLPFETDAFDCVVSTLTLCSIRGVDAAMAELFRVLKPAGRFELLEHGLHPDPAVARRQKRWNWLQRRIGDGCRLDLDVESTVRAQPFQITRLDTWQMERTPRTHGFLYRGTAVKPENAIRVPLTD